MIELPEIILLGIVLYLLYRFIFNFCVPVFRTTKQVRQQFRNMQDQQSSYRGEGGFNQQNGAYRQDTTNTGQGFSQQNAARTAPKNPPPPNDMLGEYIDFEEIK